MSMIINPYWFVAGGGGGPTIIPTTNLLFEHRGPDLTAGDGNLITTWLDHQPTNNDLGQMFGGPVQRDNTLNGLPTAEMGGNREMVLTSTQSVSAFTYAAVMKCIDGNPRTLMAGNANSPQVRINANKIELLKATTALIGTSTTTLSTSTFYTVGVTYDGTNYVFYVNGATAGSGSNAQTFSDPVRYLGASAVNAEEFAGNIAHQALYDAVLSGTDLTDLFDAMRNLWGHY